MQRVIITIERAKLVSFLTELELFLLTYLPELHEECLTVNYLQQLKQALSEPILDFHTFTICMQQFVLHVRNCVRMRTSFTGNPESESTCIHIEKWVLLKKDISSETPQKELFSIASKMINEAFNHLAEILLTLSIEEVNKE